MPLVPSDHKEFHTFVEQILVEPYDDNLKLVFADWLSDRDDPRGPLLRVVHAVRQAAGPYAALPQPRRAKIRDSKDPLVVRTGPVSLDWEWPYPEKEFIPDITRPKLESVRGAHGSGRLLSIAMVLDLIETFRRYGKQPAIRTCLSALELSSCRVITNEHRNYVMGASYVAGGGYRSVPELSRSTPAEYTEYIRNPDQRLLGVTRIHAPAARMSIDFCMSGRFGSFVNVAHTVETGLISTEGRRLETLSPVRQLHWHLRTRMIRMVDAWKAMTPWLDGKRVADAEEELKQNLPPKSDAHKKYHVHIGKYACDHARVNGKTAYVERYASEPPYGVRRGRLTFLCDLCGRERSKARRP